MSEASIIDPRHCPLCGQSNQCARQLELDTGVPQPPCWCTHAHFSSELLSRVPAPARGRACICQACAARSAASPLSQPAPTSGSQ